jgi:NitT/TauT family transport system permease protein
MQFRADAPAAACTASAASFFGVRWVGYAGSRCPQGLLDPGGVILSKEVGHMMFEARKGSVHIQAESPQPLRWRQWLAKHRAHLYALLTLIAAIGLWALLVEWQAYPPFILPSPALVWQKFLSLAATGGLWRHVGVTVLEIALGLSIGLSTAFALGYLLGKHHALERIAAPYIVASQSIPIVAIAPLIVIWMGSGLASKVAVTALITFFPTLVATIVGIRSVDPDLHDLMCSLRATRSQLFWKLELPASLPVIFGGLKLSVTLAVVGAVVGEFMGASAGLGYLINLARGILDTPMMFVAILLLVVIAQILYLSVSALEARLLRWQR